jgi:hypothetical protein
MLKLSREKIITRMFWPLAAVLIFTGCFTIPFITRRSDEEKKLEPGKREFDRSDIFVGYNSDKKPIVELRLLSQEISGKGLKINIRLFPTENFRVHNVFRGLRSINYYPIERRFHRLELRYGRKKIKTKIEKSIQVRGMKPIDAAFEHTGIFSFLPDTIDQVKLKFQDVDRWERLPQDSLANWYAIKENLLQELDRQQRRTNLIDSYKQRQKKDESKTFTQYDSIYVTTNNTYVYLDRNVDSEILYTMNAGDKIDYGMSDGVWVEIPLPDSLNKSLKEFIELRQSKARSLLEEQRRMARTRKGTTTSSTPETVIDTTQRSTGYVLDAMVQKNYQKAVGWELENMEKPVDVPLFAKVLQDRENARLARIDSLVKAKADSIARQQAIADSSRRAGEVADSLRADSLKAASRKVPAAIGASDTAKAKTQKAAASTLSDSAKGGKTQRSDSLKTAAGPAIKADSAKISAPDTSKSPAASSRGTGTNPGSQTGAKPQVPADSTQSPGNQPPAEKKPQNP